MAEEIILQDGNVTVSTARVVIAGKTYALRNITSVRMASHSPSNGCAFLLIVVGALFLMMALAALAGSAQTAVPWLVIGVAAMIIGIIIVRRNQPNHSVMIASAAGEQGALSSRNGAYISRVVVAINEAVVRYR